jgi:antitoxin Phd
MKTAWAIQEAKNRFCEVVERALTEGPQTINRHGKETAVVVSIRDFQRLIKPRGDLISFFRRSPLVGVNLDVSRARDPGREVRL